LIDLNELVIIKNSLQFVLQQDLSIYLFICTRWKAASAGANSNVHRLTIVSIYLRWLCYSDVHSTRY